MHRELPNATPAPRLRTSGKDAISRTDVAGDLLALIRHLGGPAVIVGHSISGGAATIAAAEQPDLVSAIVEINPFTQTQKLSLGGLIRIRRYRRGLTRLMGTQLLRRLRIWMWYLDVAYPTKPAEYADYMAALAAKLREPGRMAEFSAPGLRHRRERDEPRHPHPAQHHARFRHAGGS